MHTYSVNQGDNPRQSQQQNVCVCVFVAHLWATLSHVYKVKNRMFVCAYLVHTCGRLYRTYTKSGVDEVADCRLACMCVCVWRCTTLGDFVARIIRDKVNSIVSWPSSIYPKILQFNTRAHTLVKQQSILHGEDPRESRRHSAESQPS